MRWQFWIKMMWNLFTTQRTPIISSSDANCEKLRVRDDFAPDCTSAAQVSKTAALQRRQYLFKETILARKEDSNCRLPMSSKLLLFLNCPLKLKGKCAEVALACKWTMKALPFKPRRTCWVWRWRSLDLPMSWNDFGLLSQSLFCVIIWPRAWIQALRPLLQNALGEAWRGVRLLADGIALSLAAGVGCFSWKTKTPCSSSLLGPWSLLLLSLKKCGMKALK